jgi:uncharacterized protein YgiM (DUF1202 family)
MKVRLLFWLTAVSILISACGPSAAASRTDVQTNLPTQAISINPQSTPTVAPSSPTAEPPATATPNVTATPSPTPTPSGPLAAIVSDSTTCMYGPDFGYNVIDILNSGQVAQIIGRDDNTSWLQIRDPNNVSVSCWVPSISVTTTGDIANVQVVMPPMGTITKVTNTASAASSACPGGTSKIRFTATITATSWVIVDYYWTVSGPGKVNAPSGRAVFKTGGANNIYGNVTQKLPCGVYKVTLHITNPLDVSVTRTISLP